MRTALADQRRLVTAIGLPVIETHISYVLLGGRFAYKIKKAVDLDFLDFTTLAARRFYCGEELRLNQRLAPSLYLDVVPITGTVETPVLGGNGPPIEYAVKMRQFDQEGLLSRVLARGELTPERVDEIAAAVAAFHARAARAAPDAPFGRPASVMRPVRQNFVQMLAALPAMPDADDHGHLERLLAWTEAEASRLTALFERRNREGFVRECHGDLHLGNIALVDGRATLFDCIEFSPSMRWIDVMSDLGFLVMDLRDHCRPGLAARLLNAYLEATGDYAGLHLLRFYVVYRALVRAKIACLRLAQPADDGERARLVDEYRTYLALATAETSPVHRGIFITHGVTGSGKTTRAQAVVESAGAIRLRSDVERKRIAGLDAGARTASGVGGGLYSPESSRQTYARLAALARDIVSAGYAVVIDAAFLQRWQRDLVRATAAGLHVPFAIADCAAPEPVLRERVRRRLESGRDASEATIEVLEHQLAAADPLATDELSLRQ